MTAAIAEIIDAGHTIARWTELRVSEQKRTLRLTHAVQALTAARQSGHRQPVMTQERRSRTGQKKRSGLLRSSMDAT
jgi:hypothetical protein